ncbi:MAG: ATP phosphoribosyltransferase regulatory subunit, partial [Candidatus Shikimatogenerans sp. JK-2022]|nr:ATP phosphoribosyltransferase regulatory subunit [Candidatus Shikimatogenerans bostrichidophilus]
IIFPFKRYQIQKVWRGEKPQLNRYREFYQFDIDIITFKKDNNLFLELELITICENIFNKLNIQVNFNINDINILYGICILLKINKNKWEHFLITIDKINKFNIKKILNILINNNILKKKFKKKFIKLIRYNLLNKNLKKINFLIKIFIKYKITIGLKGVKNIYKLFKYIKKIKFKYLKFKIDYILSRGLNYYNNIIFEIFHNKSNISLLGGGRYDNYLKLKNKNTYYIGMSLGIYRIYNIYKNNFINLKSKNIYLLLINLNLKYFIYYKFIKYMNNYNIIVELFPYHDKIKKQIKYAKKKNINFLIFIGKKEIKNKIIKLKNLKNKKEYIFKNIHNIIIYLNKFL